MATNKVVFGNNTLIDLTADTVTAADLTVGVTAHSASGAAITGTKKEPGYITLAANTVTLDSGHEYVSIQILTYHTNNIVANISGDNVAEADVIFMSEDDEEWGSVDITSTETSGTAVITVTAAETATHTAATAYIFVTANFGGGLQTVSWASGSDDQLYAMVTADRAGTIDLRDYWDVGDERTVVLPAIPAVTTGILETQPIQPITFVLLHKGGDNDDYRFIVGTKECLTTPGRIDSVTTATTWSGTVRKTWCDNEFYNAVPSSFRRIFKQWECVSGYKSGSSLSRINVYFALAAEKEILGSGAQYSSSAERNALTQFDYYKTAANRIKIAGVNGEATKYWTRSVYSTSSATRFADINASGTDEVSNPSSTYLGLSPIGRI